MKKSKTELTTNKCCDGTSLINISDDGTVLSMVSKLDNGKNNLCSKNIFKIYKLDEQTNTDNCQSLRVKDNQANNIKIYIKNENNITNYNCSKDYAEPIIMNHRYSSKYKSNFKSSQLLNEKLDRTSYSNKTCPSQNYCGFLRKKFDSDKTSNLPSFYTPSPKTCDHVPILPRRKYTKKTDDFSSIDSLIEESFLVSDDNESVNKIEPLNYFPTSKASKNYMFRNELNDRRYKNLCSSKEITTRPIPAPRFNKLVQTDSKQQGKEYSLERKDSAKKPISLPKIIENSKNQESSNFSLFKSMNSNELGNYIDNLIQQFRIKAHICEPQMENTQFNNGIFYPENKEDSGGGKSEAKSEEKSFEDITKMDQNDNTSFDKSTMRTQSLTNLVESKAFEEIHYDDDLYESTTFINYTHSFELEEDDDDDDDDDDDETHNDQITYPSTTD